MITTSNKFAVVQRIPNTKIYLYIKDVFISYNPTTENTPFSAIDDRIYRIDKLNVTSCMWDNHTLVMDVEKEKSDIKKYFGFEEHLKILMGFNNTYIDISDHFETNISTDNDFFNINKDLKKSVEDDSDKRLTSFINELNNLINRYK